MQTTSSFSCNKNDLDHLITNFQNVFIPKLYELDKHSMSIYIGDYLYKKNCVLEDSEDIFRIAREKWCRIQDVLLNNTTILHDKILSYRKLVNSSFEAIIDGLQMIDCPDIKQKYIIRIQKCIKMFSNSVLPVSEFSEEIQIKLATSATTNVKCPIYQYFHAYLDVQYYLITLEYACGISNEKLENRLQCVLKNFITMWMKIFKRHGTRRTIFICECMKMFCLLLQVFSEKVTSTSELFWNVFNELLNDREPIFVLWVLRDISSLQSINYFFEEDGNTCDRIKPNYALLEVKLKQLLSEANSETLAEGLKLMEPIICSLWLKNAKIEIYQALWDFFSKRLNVSTKSQNISSASEFVTLIDTIIWNPKACAEDYELFVGMLITHLREHPNHWSKIKGRIYSQLGPNKVKDLTNVGIGHVMTLFIALSNVNFEELSKKLVAFLENLPQEKKTIPLVWNIYVGFLVKSISEDRSMENTSLPVIQMLQAASCDQKQFRLIKDFVNNFETVITSSVNMGLYQWLLLNSWLSKYMSVCYFQDLNKVFEVIAFTLDKCCSPDSWSQWEPTFKNHVYPNLKQLALSQIVPPIIGRISGNLAVLVPSLTNEAFVYFNNDNVLPKVTSQFLKVVLSKYPGSILLLPQQENIIIQSWVKICLTNIENCGDLTENVLKLDVLPLNLKTHLKSSNDPMYSVVEYLSRDLKQNLHSESILKLCELFFGHIDRWIPNYLNHPENDPVVFRIYTYISLAFLNCGILLYNRNKTTSPLIRLVQTLLLPTEFLIGKKQPHNFVLNAIKKTWHLFFEAIVKLNNISDTFLERTLRDLITKYMPYFNTADSPIVKCLEVEILAEVVLDKISQSYFKHPVKESEANILKVLKIIGDFVQSTTSVSLLKIVVNKVLCGLFEVIIYHSQRNSAISVVKIITTSPLYPHVRDEFCRSILSITEVNLAFNTTNYFQLLNILAKFVPNDIKRIMEAIKVEVGNVERKRGVGFDKNLRLHVEKLEQMLM